MSRSDRSLLIFPFAHLVRIKRTSFHSSGMWIRRILGPVGEVRVAPLRKGQFLEWSDPNRSSTIVWWAGHILMKNQLWMFNAFSQMQTVIGGTRQWSLSHRGKKRKSEPTFIGAFLKTTFWENNPISKEEEAGPLLQREETGVHSS